MHRLSTGIGRAQPRAQKKKGCRLREPRRSPAMPGMLRKSAAFVPRYQKILWAGGEDVATSSLQSNRWSAAMPQPNDPGLRRGRL